MYTNISSYDVNCNYAFVSDFDVDANAAWLKELAENGLRVTRITERGLVSFEKAPPCPARFYLQPAKGFQRKPPADQIQLYQEMGWDYLGTYPFHFHVFRCEDPQAPDMHTEVSTQVDDYTRLLHHTVRDCVLTLAVMMAADIGFYFRHLTPFTALNLIRPGTPLTTSIFVIFALYNLLAILTIAQYLPRIVRIRKALKEGVAPEKPVTWRKSTEWIRTGIMVVLLVFLLDPLSLNQPTEVWDNTTPSQQAVYPDLAALEGTEQSHFNSSLEHSHLFCPEIYFVDQSITENNRLRSAYYNARSEGFASHLAHDLVGEAMLPFKGAFHMEELPAPELDEFYYVDTELDVQFVVARKGTQVMRFAYMGELPLLEHLDWITASFQ